MSHPSRSFQFKTVDVQFWKNGDGKQQHNATAREASVQQKNGEMYGQYSVSRARGNEMMSDIQQQTQRTFYTVVTKPERREEYDAEVYLPSRSVSQDVEATIRRNTNRQSIRSNMSNGTGSIPSGSLPRVKMHTIRASDRVPIVRVSPHTGSTQKVETSHLVTGSIGSKLNDISGRSVVRDSNSGKKMTPTGSGTGIRGGSQPPGKVTYQYKVDASERRVEYRYHSETILYDYEQTTKREQLETWSSQQLATNKAREQQMDILQCNQELSKSIIYIEYLKKTMRHEDDDDDEPEFRSSTWNFIESSSVSRNYQYSSSLSSPISPIGHTPHSPIGGFQTTTHFNSLPRTPISHNGSTKTASTYQFHYVTRRVSQSGAFKTTLELESSQRPVYQTTDSSVAERRESSETQKNEDRNSRRRRVQEQTTDEEVMVRNGSSYSRYQMAADYKNRHSSTSSVTTIAPHQRLSQYSLHSIIDERDTIQKKTFTKWVNKHLTKTGLKVEDLFEDLRDGYALIALLEALTGERIQKENGYTRFHRIQNVQYCLDFLKKKNIKLVNIRPEDIVEGNGKLTLGLIWTIILNFQVSVIRQRLLLESQHEKSTNSSQVHAFSNIFFLVF